MWSSLRRMTTSKAAVPGDVHERRRERDPPDAERRERDVENGVEKEVAERDRRRHPVVLQAEERAVQHQHRPVERQPEAERGEARGDSRRLWRRERATLVDQARQRLGQNGGDDAGRYEQERDLPEPERARPPEAVAGRSAPRGARATGRARSRPRPRTPPAAACRCGTPRRSSTVRSSLISQPPITPSTSALMLIRPEPERDGQHHLEHPLDGRVAPVDHHLEAAVRARAATGSGSRNCTTVPRRIDPA